MLAVVRRGIGDESPSSFIHAKMRLMGMREVPSVDLGPITLHAITEADCVAHVMEALANAQGGWIVTANLHHWQLFERDREYAQLCAGASLRVADGMPLIWASHLQGTPLPERVAGSDLIWSLSVAAAANGRSVYLLGGDPGTAEEAARRLCERSPSLLIAGTACPSPGWSQRTDSEQEILDALVAASPSLVFIALGKPAQDLVIAKLLPRLPHTWFVGVGISFSFVAGRLRRAPHWMQAAGLEWLFRLLQEPSRLAGRYVRLFGSAVRLLGGSALTSNRRSARIGSS